MKAFILVCLAVAAFAEPEADPLMVLNAGHVVPSVYTNSHLLKSLVYNTAPVMQKVVSPVVQKVVSPVVQQVAQPVVYNTAVNTVAHPVMYHAALPLAQRATVHETPELEGPGGKVAAKTAVAGDITSYTVYHGMNKDKRSADSEADPALVYNYNNLGYVPSYYNQAVVNTVPAVSTLRSAYTVPAVSAVNTLPYYNAYNGLRLVKREAEAEADPALFYRSAFAGVPATSLYNNAYVAPSVYSNVYSPSVYSSSVVSPVVRAPYYGLKW